MARRLIRWSQGGRQTGRVLRIPGPAALVYRRGQSALSPAHRRFFLTAPAISGRLIGVPGLSTAPLALPIPVYRSPRWRSFPCGLTTETTPRHGRTEAAKDGAR